MAIDWIIVGALKNIKIIRNMRKVDPKYSLFSAFKYIFNYQMLHLYIPILVLIIFLSVYVINLDQAHFISPIICIGIGLLFNNIATT